MQREKSFIPDIQIEPGTPHKLKDHFANGFKREGRRSYRRALREVIGYVAARSETDRERFCWYSQARIAAHCGISEERVRQIIGFAVEQGWLIPATRWRGDALHRAVHRGWIVPEHRHPAAGVCHLELKGQAVAQAQVDAFESVPAQTLIGAIVSDDRATQTIAELRAEIAQARAEIMAMRSTLETLKFGVNLEQSWTEPPTLRLQNTDYSVVTDAPGAASLLASQPQYQASLGIHEKQVDVEFEKAKSFGLDGSWPEIQPSAVAEFKERVEDENLRLETYEIGSGKQAMRVPDGTLEFCKLTHIKPTSIRREDWRAFLAIVLTWELEYQKTSDPARLEECLLTGIRRSKGSWMHHYPKAVLKCLGRMQAREHPLTAGRLA